jgi:ubiquinone/menaquinone biosynthesis C-methylase UbiE
MQMTCPKGNRVERIYDLLAPIYDVWAGCTEVRARRRAIELAGLRDGETVLEVAIGTGLLLKAVIDSGWQGKPIGIDLSRAMLGRASRRLSPGKGSPLALCRADARRLPFASSTFDVIISTYLLDLLREDEIESVLSEFRKVIKPGGRAVLVQMGDQSRLVNKAWMWLYHHAPALVGGCRPVEIRHSLGVAGWRVEEFEQVLQGSFRSNLYVVRPS